MVAFGQLRTVAELLVAVAAIADIPIHMVLRHWHKDCETDAAYEVEARSIP